MNRFARRWGAATVAVLALGTLLAACGDDDDDEAASGSPSASEAEAGDLDVYCEKTVEIENPGEPDVDFESASEEEIATAVKAFANDELLPIADDIVANAPEEVHDDIDVLYAAVEKVAETGDFEGAFDTPEVEAASARVHDHDVEACDWEQVDVTAKDYAFEGIPEELGVGVVSFEFTNGGKEAHELLVIRKNDDTTESFDDLLKLPEEEARQKTTFVGATFGEPGDEDYVVLDLEAGEYLAVCFIPTGTTGEDHEGDGPPHAFQGMKHEFTVS